jgi:hypothetical protein
MCLFITVRGSQPFQKKLKSVSQVESAAGASEKISFSLKSKSTLSLSLGGGCACSRLTEDADWNDVYRNMKPQALILLAQAVERIAEQQPNGFTFQALWVEERAKELRSVSLDKLISIIRAGQIETDICYDVS